MSLPSVTTPPVDSNALAYALARDECGEKLGLVSFVPLLPGLA
jgi:hypothetical protein